MTKLRLSRVSQLGKRNKKTFLEIPIVLSIALILVLVFYSIFLVIRDAENKKTILPLITIGIFIILIFLFVLVFFDVRFTKRNSNELEAQNLNLIYALCKSYDSVYFVNLENHRMFAYVQSDAINEKYGKVFSEGDYEKNFNVYVENEVYEEDKKILDNISTIKKIKNLCQKNSEFSLAYRILRNKIIHYYECSLVRPSEERSEVVLAFKNIDKLKQPEQRMERMIEEQAYQINLLSSLGGIYESIHVLDLLNDTVVEISSTREINKLVNRHDHIVELMKSVIENVVDPEFLDNMLEFTDLTTIAERLYGKRVLSTEFIGRISGWCQSSFISTEPTSEIPQTIIFATRVIEHEKRAQNELLEMSNTDKLTGLCNRRAYENDIKNFEPSPYEDDFVFVSIDVNGLKTVNDSFGHAAGDELLKGAAMCLRASIGSFGRLYRIGGDEFAAIIFADEKTLKKLKKNLRETAEKWKGTLVDKLSISCGFVSKKEFPDSSITQIESEADQRMYREKAEYYAKLGIDRRGLQSAYETICKSYAKILRVNLTDDCYTIIRMDESEKVAEKGFSEKISEWLQKFPAAGLVHPDDVDEFLEKTSLPNLQEYFMKNNSSLCFHYRRKIEDSYRNVIMEMIPAKEYTDEKQIIFLYVKDIEY